MPDFNLNDHVYRLLQKEPFFAALSRRIDKKEADIPTAGVRINEDGHFEMVYNPDFFSSLTDKQRAGVLIHEFYHLIFEHVTGRLPDELASVMQDEAPTSKQTQLFKIWNIAADLSINYHIGADNLPEKCCIPGGPMFEDLPGDMTAEWYYAELVKKAKEQKNEDNAERIAEGQFDSHAEWGKGSLTTDQQDVLDIAKERLKESLKEAASEASTRGWGAVSASCRKEIMDRIISRVDWRKMLRYFVKTSQRSNKRSTPKRLNRRYAYVHPGRKVNRTASIAVSIDQSGSVSDSMLAAFYGELNKLASLATFTVIPFDTQVAEDKVYVWKRGENRIFERVMYGGTDFNPPTEYVNERNFDGHLVLTDMMAPRPKASKCQRMWMTTKVHAERPYFKTTERVVAIDEA